MIQQAKWFSLSLVLHLAAAVSLVFISSRAVERTPKTIMVVLDNRVPGDIPRDNDHRVPPAAATRPATPDARPEQAKPEMPRQVHQPAAPQSPTAPAPDPNHPRELPKASAEVLPAAAIQRRVEGVNPAPAPQGKLPAPHSAPAAEERPTVEKAQQLYLKEHFAYIRDLITKQLVYPPMARRMRWSGKTVVAFVIAEDGSIHNLRVVETSGYPTLDICATETVRNVSPFPRPPVRAEIVVPVSFKML